jgi:hypothetical protein
MKKLAVLWAALKLFVKLHIFEKIVAVASTPAGSGALRALPGLIAFALIAYGVSLVFLPAGFIVGGVLLLLDRAL